LPVFIKNMQMLGLTLDDLKEYTKGKNGEAMNN
jgi:hypothetical protein